MGSEMCIRDRGRGADGADVGDLRQSAAAAVGAGRQGEGMKDPSLRLVLISTPIGALGSGRGGGVELTLRSLAQGLVMRQHQLTLIAPRGSQRPVGCDAVELVEVDGVDQPSWQHASEAASVEIPRNAVLPRLLDAALQRADNADALLNFGYDWLPLWVTPHLHQPLFHLISMGG